MAQSLAKQPKHNIIYNNTIYDNIIYNNMIYQNNRLSSITAMRYWLSTAWFDSS